MKRLLILILLSCGSLLAQTYPPSAISAQNPNGRFVYIGMDSSGSVFTDGSGSLVIAAAIQGYVPPVAMTGQNPSGNQVYLKTDAFGNLLVNCNAGCSGSGGTVTTVLPLTGTSTISCPTCAVTGSGLNQFAATTSAQLASTISDASGSGALIFGTSPTLTTPNLGTPSAINLANATFPASIGLTANPLSQFASTTSAQLAGVMSNETGTGLLVFGTSPTLVTPILGTPTSVNLANATFPASIALTANTLAQFAVTTSAQFAGVITDETGTGVIVYSTSPTLTAPNLGTPTAVNLSNASNLPWTAITGQPCNGNENVASSTTPTFSATTCSSRIVLTGNITTFTLAAGSDGESKCLNFVQGAGPYTVVPPVTVVGFFTVGIVNAKRNQQCFTYYASDTAWVAQSAGVINQ